MTDRTAGWLLVGNRMLAPGEHEQVLPISVFCPPGHRLRSGLTASGERCFAREDTMSMEGLQVSTPLRTACDLGRLLHRDQAFAAMDALLSLRSFSRDGLLMATTRFKGYRGVIQLRMLGPFIDARSESSGESILRLRWLDAGLPRPQRQVEVPTAWGTTYRVDLGLPGLRCGAEYDGERVHGPDRAVHDAARRQWLREAQGWQLVVARRENVHGRHQDVEAHLRSAYQAARRGDPPVDYRRVTSSGGS